MSLQALISLSTRLAGTYRPAQLATAGCRTKFLISVNVINKQDRDWLVVLILSGTTILNSYTAIYMLVLALLHKAKFRPF